MGFPRKKNRPFLLSLTLARIRAFSNEASQATKETPEDTAGFQRKAEGKKLSPIPWQVHVCYLDQEIPFFS